MVDPHTHGCLEPEVLAAYADHGLSLAERARVERHLASCPQCTALLAGVVRTVADVAAFLPDTGAAEATPPWTRRAGLGALAAAAAVIAVVTAPALVGPWLARDTGLVSLVGSVGEQRSVLGRLTGGFPHAPLDEPSAGGQGGRAAEADRVLLTAGRIRESFGDYVAPSDFHALGVAQLLAGRLDDATQSLQAAAHAQPSNARYANDLATAHLERARRGLRPDDLPRALAAAERARRLDPSLTEAWFNRAAALTALSLKSQARAAWAEYLARDAESRWAGEARRFVTDLERPTPVEAWAAIEVRLAQAPDAAIAEQAVRTQTTEARRYLETVLFARWADAALGRGGDVELAHVDVMAEAMLRVTGDALYRDAVDAIERASARGQVRALAAAHRHYAAAARLLDDDRYADAAAGMTAAIQQFSATGSPMATLATIGVATTAYYAGRLAEVERLLRSVESDASAKSYGYAVSRAAWIRGLVAFGESRFGDAQAHYEDSLAAAERMGDVEQAAGAHLLLSGVADQLGDTVAEWRHRQVTLDALSVSRSPRFLIPALMAAALSTRADNPETALALLDDVVASARNAGREAAVVDALVHRAATQLLLGRTRDAADTSAEARRQLARVPDTGLRTLLELPVLAVEIDLQVASNPQAAVAAAQHGLDTLRARNDRARTPQFLLRLAKANIVWGRLDDAERALNAGIQAFDETRPRTGTGVRLTDETSQLFEVALSLAVRRGDHERAFTMAERTRALSTPDQATQSLAAAQAAALPNEAIVALNQLEDELVVWIIRRDGSRVATHPLRRTDARRLVAHQHEEHRLALASPSASAALYDSIVRPVAPLLEGATRIIFVPDATFRDVGFAALWDRSRNRFLVEDAVVSTVPLVSTVASAGGRGRRTAAGEKAFVIAADAADPAAVAIGGWYQAPVVPASGATRTTFLTQAGDSDVVHLAVQTHANPIDPLLSRVMLGDEPGRRHSGAVLGRDIAARQFRETRLVVLDNTDNERREQVVSQFGLASVFLTAGVPAVLGTLPGGDEADVRELLVGFHRQAAADASAAETLARIQRNVLQQNGRRLGAWSALVLYGSDR
jgi:CHAT domain-containing protein/tetratricopeptide (TPR) repeat protein